MRVATAIEPRDTPHGQRICVVTETYPPEINGVAHTLAHLVKGLAGLGHSVSLVRPYQRMLDFRRAGDSTVMLVRGLPLPGYKGLQFGLPATGLLRQSWTRLRPDAVYVATEGPLGWSAVRAARGLGIPVLTGFHTNYHAYSRHYRVGWLQQLVFRYLCGFHNRSTGTLVASADLRDRLQAQGFRNVNVLGRGVDSDLFAPQHRSHELRRNWGVSDDDLVIVYVGRLAPEKNLGLAVDAYRAMKRISPSLKFVIVGDGPLRAALQKEHPDLIFMGTHTGERLARYYASADVFLFPSETETFGNVTLEAMASGLVVTAYNYAAAKLHITHGETGVLVRYGDSKAFVESAVKLVQEPQSLQKIKRQAREYVSSLCWTHVVKSFETLLLATYDPNGTASSSWITRQGLAT